MMTNISQVNHFSIASAAADYKDEPIMNSTEFPHVRKRGAFPSLQVSGTPEVIFQSASTVTELKGPK